MDYRYRYLLTFTTNPTEFMEESKAASQALSKLMDLQQVCQVVRLKPDEVVGNAKEFQAAVSDEVTAELNRSRARCRDLTQERENLNLRLHDVAVRFEDLCGVLELIAESTKSKKLHKFVKRSRKILNSSETSQTLD